MKKTILAALALLTLASCAKENSDQTTPVAAIFSEASISRVADNKWQTYDQIGISMTVSGSTDSKDIYYENIPYTVDDIIVGTFTADSKVIYFPEDDSTVDFYAYYPQSTLNEENNIVVNVATQSSLADIDIIAATASTSKASPEVTFTGTNAFMHQLSKLVLTMRGEGIDNLIGLETIIKKQYTTATYNIYTNSIDNKDNKDEITALTSSDGMSVEAILIPTDKIADSTIEFKLDGDTYTLDTDDFEFIQGYEYRYEITLKKTDTSATITSSTNDVWD